MKNNTNEILKNELNNQKQVSAYAANAIRPAIIARSIDGSKRAINLKMAEDAGVTKERLDQWKNQIDSLYTAACDFGKAVEDGIDSTEAQAELAKVWSNTLKVGEADVLHPNMFIRDKDTEDLRVYATALDHKWISGIGFVGVYTGLERFRGIIETRLALRIASNATLNDEDRTTLETYQIATKRVADALKVINGYTEGKTVVSSLSAQITDAEGQLDEMVSVLEAAGVKDVEKYTAGKQAVVDNLKKKLANAQKKLKKYKAIVEETEDSYNKIIERLDSIEGKAEIAPAPVPETKEQRKDHLTDLLNKAKKTA